jgi:hypothetical protein
MADITSEPQKDLPCRLEEQRDLSFLFGEILEVVESFSFQVSLRLSLGL